MTATDELRRLLDEHGVEWTKPKSATEFIQTTFLCNGWGIEVLERNIGLCATATNTFDTPEQAIAATLGAEPDDATMVRMHDKMNTALIKYEQAQGIERREGDGKDVVPFVAEMHRLLDEAATLGNDGVGRTNDGVVERGTCDVDCTVKWDWDCCETYWEHELSCGHTITTMEPEPPNFCQDCGAEVVK